MKKKTGPSGETRHHESHGQTSSGRRGALKRLVLGSAAAGVAASLPARWTQPIVQSVMLPAHAQTSPGDIEDGDFFADLSEMEVRGERIDHLGNFGTAVASRGGWLDWLVPTAHAGGSSLGSCLPCGACARIQNGGVTVVVSGLSIDPEGEVCFQATGSILGPADFTQVRGPGGACSNPGTISIVGLEGEAPNRTLVLDTGTELVHMEEDPSRSCSCNTFECVERLEAA